MSMSTLIPELQAIESVVVSIATAIIAGAGVKIALQQSVTSAHKLRLDMFPRRFAVYQSAMAALTSLLTSEDSAQHGKDLRRYFFKLQEARFIFNKPTFEDLDALYTRAIQQQHIIRRVKNLNIVDGEAENREAGERLYAQQTEGKTWLLQRMNELAPKLESQMKVDSAASFSLLPLTRDDYRNV